MKITIKALLLGIACSSSALAEVNQSSALAEVNQFEHCNALIRHGMQDINTKYSSDVSNGYNYHKYCRTTSESMKDDMLSAAEASIFGYGDAGGSFNRSQAITKLDKFCEENKSISSRSSSLYVEASKYSGPALEAWNQCQQAARKLVQINLTHRSENATKLAFAIDSTQDGTLYLTGVEHTGYSCTVYNSNSDKSGNVPLTPDSRSTNVLLSFSQVPINNNNIHISCDRQNASIDSGNEVKTLKFEEGSVSIFTTGPSFSITVPEVVSDYHHTPKNSVLAFAAESCPSGWDKYEPAYGRFIRGFDASGKNVNPEGAEQKIGDVREDTFKLHEHKQRYANVKGTFNPSGWETVPHVSRDGSDGVNTGSNGSSETRPKNVALLYCIKT